MSLSVNIPPDRTRGRGPRGNPARATRERSCHEIASFEHSVDHEPPVRAATFRSTRLRRPGRTSREPRSSHRSSSRGRHGRFPCYSGACRDRGRGRRSGRSSCRRTSRTSGAGRGGSARSSRCRDSGRKRPAGSTGSATEAEAQRQEEGRQSRVRCGLVRLIMVSPRCRRRWRSCMLRCRARGRHG